MSTFLHRSGPASAPARAGAEALRPVYQPVRDLADGTVVGYEALARGTEAAGHESPAELFAAARAEDRLTELDAACLRAAIRDALETTLGAPYTLFLNAEPTTFAAPLPLAGPSLQCIVELTDRALALSPAAVLAALERIRAGGWGVALDAVGADPRTLALISLLQPDVIKLDLPRIRARGPEHLAAVVAAVGVERERSGSTILAKGIESDVDLDLARAAGATLGQGFHLGRPEALPLALPAPGRPVKLIAAGADPWGSTPWRRVTNLHRPQTIGLASLQAVAGQLEEQAAAFGPASGLLELLPAAAAAGGPVPEERRRALATRIGALRVLGPTGDPELDRTWTVAAFGPFFAGVLVARADEAGESWHYALSYDRRTAIECALILSARLPSTA